MRAILTYHSIDDSGSVLSLSPGAFRRHARWLSSGRVRVTSIDELLTLSEDEEALALTFDDGFENFATEGWPLLRDLGLPATLFVVSGHAGGTNAWNGAPQPGIPELPLLNWETLGRLAEQGLSLGSHAVSHRPLPELDADVVEEELARSSEEIRDRTGAEVRGFAYPYGAWSPRCEAAVARRYRWACTTELRPLPRRTAAAHRLPRLDAYYYRDHRHLEAWGSGSFRRRLWVRSRARGLRSSLARRGRHP
ncbi:MAG: polysaccharide deacetylase family protein [Gemmatimonadota bacterium]